MAIGTCTVAYGRNNQPIIICPYRLLDASQIFTDCLHLLTLHEPGNQLHVVPEISIPGGSLDYVLVSARRRKVADFVGVELQTLDTTGTAWPERQRFLGGQGLRVDDRDASSDKPFGMNWKMTTKTVLVQLHHKVGTFQHLNKHLALVLQDRLLEYMRREFSFGHIPDSRLGDPMHFHAYAVKSEPEGLRLELTARLSTDVDGISTALGLQVSPNVALAKIIDLLEARLSHATLVRL